MAQSLPSRHVLAVESGANCFRRLHQDISADRMSIGVPTFLAIAVAWSMELGVEKKARDARLGASFDEDFREPYRKRMMLAG